jgi:all-trans-8'-apo-beta-carotenal 15,15'-oxygenase
LFALSFGAHDTLVTFYELDAQLKVCRETPVRVPGFAYFHDVVVTDEHYVFFKHALGLQLCNAMHSGIAECMVSDRKATSLLYAVPRAPGSNGSVRCVPVPHGFMTHHASSSYEGDTLGVVSVMYPDPFRFNLEAMMNAGYLFATTWNMETNQVTRKRVADKPLEFPCTDSAGMIYGIVGNGLVQVDPASGATVQWHAGAHGFLGEPVLVGERYLAATCFSSAAMQSFLLVFDTHQLTSGPVATLRMPGVHPVGLHGSFIDEAEQK